MVFSYFRTPITKELLMDIMPKILASDLESELIRFGDNYDIALNLKGDGEFKTTGIAIFLTCSIQGIIISWIKGQYFAVTQEFDTYNAQQTESLIKELLNI